MTLHSVFIFLQSGETLVSHSSPVVKLEQTLLTGLLTAIREFGHEAIAEEIRTIGAGEYRFHYDVYDKTSSSAPQKQGNKNKSEAPIGLITVGLADGNADELEVQAVLHSLNVLFYAQYEPLLEKWNGDVKPFQSFLPIINDALEAHNERSQVAKRRISSAEYILEVFEETLDVVLLNILVGNAIIITGVKNKKFQELSEAIDNVLPFTVPNMLGITDLETAQGILQSRKEQQRKRPTLLGVSEKIYRSLTTPQNLEHYLFVNLSKKSPVFIAPSNQPSMDLAQQALEMAKDDVALQAKLLELQFDTLRVQLASFMELRRSAQHFTLEHLRSLLHLDSERFRLLTYLSQESILAQPPEPEVESKAKGE
ncbi:MAG: hypothetical protein ACFFCH_11095 [Promethearchaeota archaeon]